MHSNAIHFEELIEVAINKLYAEKKRKNNV
jgi:hypothetical protein